MVVCSFSELSNVEARSNNINFVSPHTDEWGTLFYTITKKYYFSAGLAIGWNFKNVKRAFSPFFGDGFQPLPTPRMNP